MNFIKEYQLKDLSICDSLIDLFWKADKNDLTYAGRVGGGSIIPDIKKSKDFMLGEGGSLGKPISEPEVDTSKTEDPEAPKGGEI